jgi:hypothetical protein
MKRWRHYVSEGTRRRRGRRRPPWLKTDRDVREVAKRTAGGFLADPLFVKWCLRP